MKIVLSRKGFDSSAGGVPSPILPDGRLRSLPIPDPESPLRYCDIRGDSPRIASLVTQLAPALRRTDRAHLDPDLCADHSERPPGWRPAFGQAGAALGHLDKHAVGEGDLFLFFGWFRAVERRGRRWRYAPEAPDLHVIYGWLQVGEMVDLDRTKAARPWSSHVHCRRHFGGRNRLYLAPETLRLGTSDVPLPGGGAWPRLSAERTLTRAGRSRSHWRLPHEFLPIDSARGLDCLSCHTRLERWRDCGSHCELHTVPRGQEFVLDCVHRPGVLDWLESLYAPAGQP